MGLANARFYESGRFFWDERAASLEEQVITPIQDPVEMGMDLDVLVEKLANVAFYPPLFESAFGDPAVSSDRISRALAQFVRSMVSSQSRYDLALSAINGQDASSTIKQVFAAMGSGTLLYFARRISGTLLVPMALHAMFDATLIIHGGPGAELNNDTADPAAAPSLFQFLGVIFLIIALVKHYLERDNPGPELEPLMGGPSAA